MENINLRLYRSRRLLSGRSVTMPSGGCPVTERRWHGSPEPNQLVIMVALSEFTRGLRCDEDTSLLEAGVFLRRVHDFNGLTNHKSRYYDETRLFSNLSLDSVFRSFIAFDPAPEQIVASRRSDNCKRRFFISHHRVRTRSNDVRGSLNPHSENGHS
jgi:hypothetical protein